MTSTAPVAALPADTTAATAGDGPRAAPLGRLLGSELTWVLRRPRTLVMLGVLSLIPVVISIGVTVMAGDVPGPRGGGLVGAIAGNGLVLPVASITLALALLLPMAVTTAAADAIAGEAASGTLRGLLLSPVGRLRLVLMKAFGVLVVATLAVLVIAAVGVLAALVVVGSADGQLITLSGTTIGFGEAVGRVLVVVVWTVGQLAAVGAIALAISSLTEHPMVVLAAVLGGLIVFGVLTAIPALDWLGPYLLTSGWTAGADVLRDPMPWGGLIESSLRALCYAAVGTGLTTYRMLRRDA